MNFRRIGVKYLHLSDGTVLKDQVVEFRRKYPPVYYPLCEELPNTEWMRDFYL